MKKGRFISNSLSILINRLVQSLSAFVLTATIARTLGAEILGQYLLAFTYYFMFVSIISQGLKTLLTRELAREPEHLPKLLVNGVFLQSILALIGYISLAIIVLVLPYGQATTTTCLLMGLSIFPFALSNITEGVLQAQERMYLIAASTVPVYILRLCIMLGLMFHGYGIYMITIVFGLSEIVVFGAQWFLTTSNLTLTWKLDTTLIRQTVVNARSFFAIEAMSIVGDRLQILILSLLGSEQMIGFYGGIMQLMQPYLMIANSLAFASFPSMSQTADKGEHGQRKIIQNTLELLLCLALPMFLGFYFVGDRLLLFVYGEDSGFAEAFTPFRIIALTLLLLPFQRTLSFALMANKKEHINLIETGVSSIIGGFCGTILIANFQLIGAGITQCLISLSSFLQYFIGFQRTVFSIHLWAVIYRPLIISLPMGLLFLWLSQSSLSFLIILAISTIVYGVITGGLMLSSSPALRAKFLRVLTKNQNT